MIVFILHSDPTTIDTSDIAIETINTAVSASPTSNTENKPEILTTVTNSAASIGTPGNPARSCADIPLDNPSGYYTLHTEQSDPFSAFCDMSPGKCNDTKGWTRIGYLNMSLPNHSCPTEFSTYTTSTGLHFCYNPSINKCVSTIYSTRGIAYSQVTGKVVGYQYGKTKAFHGYNVVSQRTLDDAYVDGVSVTIGEEKHRHHIWTFASAYSEGDQAFYSYTCPCTSEFAMRHTGFVPPYVGEDYFCDTGAVEDSFGHIPVETDHLYTEHPLWDGSGCGDGSKCCEFSNPPWFCKQLDETVTNDIELRLCAYSSSPYISEISLYIK